MKRVNVSDFRSHLPEYLGQVENGEEIHLTSRGKVIALVTPVPDHAAEARARLASLRETCTVGDVVSPLEEKWEAADADP